MTPAVGSHSPAFHTTDATPDLEWDDEADVVCTDAGLPGLATAICAVDDGVEVFVAGAPETEAGATDRGWFTLECGDSETAAYLTDLTADLDVAALAHRDDDLPIRWVREPADRPGRKIAPFVGSRLRDWSAECIPAPSGYLYTRVTDWTSTAMESGDGEAFEVTEIGSMTVAPGDDVGSVLDWLGAEAHMRGVRVYRAMRFERLVFEGGQVIGAVFATSDGPFAVRARHGVLLCRAGSPAGEVGIDTPDGAVLRVALVSRVGSRFGRVELLTADPAVASDPAASVRAATTPRS
ncbi:hypothetical protein [Mycolicibacterium pyrenivorans]|uniref:hypothetical protein n=1 Tax=Mycolicibacterium pyrenivorans TaxID=187102 RepID=UPI0021F3A68D|nr:hypothetical protein [Mycolicibacterium pyrenivorans]MCV7152082.1 hypothetical protein [Mycolicibacterium pyrenivorans]